MADLPNDRYVIGEDGTLRFELDPDRRALGLGLALWLVDAYKPAGYPFGKTMQGLVMWVRFQEGTTAN